MEYSGEENLKVMQLAKKYNNFLLNLIIKEISDNAKTIVDFGSGNGYFAKAVAEKTSCQVIGVEPAQNMHKYYSNTPTGIISQSVILETDLCRLVDNSVDVIYSLNVLEHIENDKEIVDLFFRKLKTGGKVVLYLPAFKCLWSSMDNLVGHFRRYRKSDVRRLFQDEWQVKETRYADFAGWFVTLIFKLIGNNQGAISPTSLKIYDKFIFPISRLCDKITGGRFLGKNIIITVVKK